MSTQLHYGRRMPSVLLLLAFSTSSATIHLSAQLGASSPPETNSTALTYEVASIKLATPGDREVGWKTLPNGFDFRNLPLAPLIYQAYGITFDSQMSGLPQWAKTDRYDLSARVGDDTADLLNKLSKKEQAAQQQRMLQALLADRCRLKVQTEIKESPVYELVVAAGGVKMKDAAADEKSLMDIASTTFHGQAGQTEEYTMTMSAHAVTAEEFAQNLPHYADRIVVDKTALGDRHFDFELKWSSGGPDLPDSANAGPSLFKAIEEELGLKLEPAKEPVETFVVDHIERPSAN